MLYHRRCALLACCLSLSPLSCLPGDTRPPPASLLVTASAGAALRDGIAATTDGWSISFDRLLVSLGRTSLEGDTCTTYSEARYSRIFDVVAAPEPQKVSLLYGLGQCDFSFRVSRPSGDSILGPGVGEADLTRMRTPGSDAYAEDRGVSVEVRGSAAKGAETKTFDWVFRQSIRYDECAKEISGASIRGFELEGEQAGTVNIALHGEALFQDSLDSSKAALRFNALAAADDDYGDANGEITLGELAKVPLADIAVADAYAEDGDGHTTFTSLEDYVYLGLVPALARFRDDGTCTTTVGDRGR